MDKEQGSPLKQLAMAVVVRRGRVLIQQRYRHNRGRVCEFPGGSVDCGETGEQAAIRELWEETGLQAVSVLGARTGKNASGGDITYVMLSIADGSEPVETDPDRQQRFFWYSPQQIPPQDFFAADLRFIREHLTPLLQGTGG